MSSRPYYVLIKSTLYSLHSLLIVLFHLGTMTKKKYLAYHHINYDSSFSMLSYSCTNHFSREITLHRNRRDIHTIFKISTQIGLSKYNNLIFKIELSKRMEEVLFCTYFSLCNTVARWRARLVQLVERLLTEVPSRGFERPPRSLLWG